MLIDNRMIFLDAEPIADADVVVGEIDLYGLDIATFPDSNLSRVHGRGKGSAVLVHIVINPDTTTPLGGPNALATLKIGSSSPATWTVLDYEMVTPFGLSVTGNKGAHYVFAIPYSNEGRYLSITLDLTSTTGLGPNAEVTSFIFAQ